MVIKKRLRSPMYSSTELSDRAKKNNWHVREINKGQPDDLSWREWWDTKGFGKGHIEWRSTCIATNVPDPFNPPSRFEVQFEYDNIVYNLEFTLVLSGPNL